MKNGHCPSVVLELRDPIRHAGGRLTGPPGRTGSQPAVVHPPATMAHLQGDGAALSCSCLSRPNPPTGQPMQSPTAGFGMTGGVVPWRACADPDLSPAVIRQDRVGKPGHGAYSQTPIPGRSAGLDRKPVLPRPARALSPPCSGLLVATGPSPQPPARRNRGRAELPN